MRRTGKRVAIAAAVLGIATFLAWAGIAIPRRLAEDRAIARLASADPAARRAAAARVEEMGSVRAIPAILEAIEEEKRRSWIPGLGDPISDLEREKGAIGYLEDSLGRIIERRGPAAVGQLLSLLRSPKKTIRGAAAERLGTIGPEARRSIPSLLACLRESPPVAEAAQSLVEVGAGPEDMLPDLIRLCRHPDRWIRSRSAEAVWLLGKAGAPAIPALIECMELDHRDGCSNCSAASALFLLGGDAVGPLTEFVARTEGPVRREAIERLCLLKASSSVPALAGAIDDGDAGTALAAIRALGAIGRDARTAVPALLAKAKDPDREKRVAALEALGSIGLPAGEVLSVLREALGSEEEMVRVAAAKALGRLGPAAGVFKDTLTGMIGTDRSYPVRAWAACAVAKIDPQVPDPVVAKMLEWLHRGERARREHLYAAIGVLGELGPIAKEAVPDLAEICLEEKGDFTREAAAAIGEIGIDGEGLKPLLDAVRQQGRIGYRTGILELFPCMRPPAAVVTGPLAEVLGDPSAAVRRRAAEALFRIRPDAPAAGPALHAALRDRDRQVRFWARLTLMEAAGDERRRPGDQRAARRSTTAAATRGASSTQRLTEMPR